MAGFERPERWPILHLDLGRDISPGSPGRRAGRRSPVRRQARRAKWRPGPGIDGVAVITASTPASSAARRGRVRVASMGRAALPDLGQHAVAVLLGALRGPEVLGTGEQPAAAMPRTASLRDLPRAPDRAERAVADAPGRPAADVGAGARLKLIPEAASSRAARSCTSSVAPRAFPNVAIGAGG